MTNCVEWMDLKMKNLKKKKNQTTKLINIKNSIITRKKLLPGQGLYITATILLVIAILLVLLLHICPVKITFHYPCLLKEIFHIYCPGCGGTRAINELMHFHFLKSFLSNPIVIYLAGIYLYYYIGTTLAILYKGRRIFFHAGNWMWIMGLIIIVLNTILRNYLAIKYGIDYLGDIAQYWLK